MRTFYLYGDVVRYRNYLDAFRLIGADCAFLSSPELPQGSGALLLPGGGDLHPACYGQGICGARNIDADRDAAELRLVQQAISRGIPIFGICRGMQVLNVALGGTLLQDVKGHNAQNGRDSRHTVSTDDADLSALYGNAFAVPSAHHQAVSRLGDGFLPTAVAPDGVIEAMRHRTLPIMAVQWHPERACGAFASHDLADGAALFRLWANERTL